MKNKTFKATVVNDKLVYLFIMLTEQLWKLNTKEG